MIEKIASQVFPLIKWGRASQRLVENHKSEIDLALKRKKEHEKYDR